MSRLPARILVVDDDKTSCILTVAILEQLGYLADAVDSGAAALERMRRAPVPDLLLLDLVMAGMDGIETLQHYRAAGGAAPIVIVSGQDNSAAVIRALRAGASDYVVKPIAHRELDQVIGRTIDRYPLRAATSTTVLAEAQRRSRLGVSPGMVRIDALIDRVADADAPILITGETGVGKGVIAEEIHARSERRGAVFVKLNCAALPETLLESELFGHERGAFTGAERMKPGQFEMADGGTLFLDEIGEMPVALQAKLLQALQDGEFYRVGGQRKVKVDVRTIAATNRDLERAIRGGAFREDLFYRLNVISVHVPPLRERTEDIPALIVEFHARYGRGTAELPPELVARLTRHSWPGNVRELENAVRRLAVLGDPAYVLAELEALNAAAASHAPPVVAALPPPAVAAAPSTPGPLALGPTPALQSPLATTPAFYPHAGHAGPSQPASALTTGSNLRLGEVVAAAFAAAGQDGHVDLKALGRVAAEAAEREAIATMLAKTGGSKREAAERLGICYKAILYKLRDYGLS